MMKFNFDRIFRARGIDKPYSFLVQSGFSNNFATRVRNNRIKMMSPDQFEQLCVALRCTPNDLFDWVPEKHIQAGKDHPLYALNRPGEMIDMTKTLQSIPLDRLGEIEALINERIRPGTEEKE